MAHPEPGVLRQMQWEQRAAREIGLEWDCRLLSPAPLAASSDREEVLCSLPNRGSDTKWRSTRFLKWCKQRRAFYRWIIDEADNYDIVLLRATSADPFRTIALRTISPPVLSVHHTLEVPELRASGSAGPPKALLEQIIGPASISATRAIVGVTGEICAYQQSRVKRHMPALVYPNGVWFSEADNPSVDDERGVHIPELLFIASYFAPWHGLDRLLQAVKASNRDFILHLVGRLPQDQLDTASSDLRIKCHGVLDISRIRALSARCWLGLSSFALDRNGLSEACTLKVREYLASGIPVYAGHKDVFPDDFEFFRQGQPLVDEILEYAHKMRRYERNSVRAAARSHIDKRVLVEELFYEMQKLS